MHENIIPALIDAPSYNVLLWNFTKATEMIDYRFWTWNDRITAIIDQMDAMYKGMIRKMVQHLERLF